VTGSFLDKVVAILAEADELGTSRRRLIAAENIVALVAEQRFGEVAGYCPMGCGQTLFLGKDGHVTCSFAECPDPCKVDDLLHDRETEHVVEIREHDFTVKHPLRERPDELLECDLHAKLAALDGPPARLGRYRVRRHRNDPTSESRRSDAFGWDFEPLEGTA
jgi:hypothetical protein